MSGPALADPAELIAAAPRPLAVIGEGIAYHRATVEAAGITVIDPEHWVPDAQQVLQLGAEMARQGKFIEPRDLIPEYIRRPEAEELWEKRHRAGTPQ
jgi:tRNA threonylcarbamoyladenosine biosynthesis protein TsaB